MKKGIFFFILTIISNVLLSQDSAYARKWVNKLCSDKYAGRGYANHGCEKAAKDLSEEMQKIGLHPLPAKNTYLLPFNFPVNLIKSCKLTVNGKLLKEGNDYLVDPGMKSLDNWIVETRFIIQNQSFLHANFVAELRRKLQDNSEVTYVIDTLSSGILKQYGKLIDSVKRNGNVISLVTKLTYSVATKQTDRRNIQILRSVFPAAIKSILRLKYSGKSDFFNTTQYNVAGMVKGKEMPDSFLLFTAHYDHLGKMGKAVFPGANDNACGVATLLDMAKYYVKNPHKYSILFVCFAGEEAGLIGSNQYVAGDMHPIHKTKFVFNLDLVGTGEGNSTVVNATIYPWAFNRLDSLNKQYKLVPGLVKRGKAANSDHYWFTEKGIPAFFLYQSGPRNAYHDVNDIPQTLSMSGYKNTFTLIRRFYDTF